MKNKFLSAIVALISILTASMLMAQDKLTSFGQLAAVYQSQGDMMTIAPSGLPQRIPIGSTGQVLVVSGSLPSWSSSPVLSGITSAASITLTTRSDVNRIFTFDGPSDTVLTLAIGDTTASQVAYIMMGTSDGSDTSVLEVGGGGGNVSDGTRGGQINLYGNEAAGAGKVDVVMGGTANFRVVGNTGAQAVLTVEGDADGGVVINTGRLDFSAAVSTLKPGATSFQINNNANSIANFKIVDAGGITIADTLVSTRTSDFGWTVVDQTNNQACNTGCTSACVFGWSLTTDTTSPVLAIVSCSDTTADMCLCAGAS